MLVAFPDRIFSALREKTWISRGERESENHSVTSDPLCNLMDYTVHGILQARILEWIAVSFSRGSSQPRDQNQISHTAGRIFNSWVTKEPIDKDEKFSIPWDNSSLLLLFSH